MAHNLLTQHSREFGMGELMKAVNMLDAPRRVRALEKKMARLEQQATTKAETKKKVKQQLHDVKLLTAQLPQDVPFSGVLYSSTFIFWYR